MSDLVRSKFDPVVASSRLKDKVEKDVFSRRAVYSTVLKRIGGTHYFFRGSWTATKAQSIDADILVVDELDFQKPDVRLMYEERLEGSGSKDIIYWIGTPTLPGLGISELYEQSDQREWNIQCPKCHKIQVLEWPLNISFKKKTFICKFCRTNLSKEDRKNGKWISKFPGRDIHGYQFNRMMAPWITAEKLIKLFKSKSPKHFWNFSLGLPYLQKSQRFSEQSFRKAQMPDSDYEVFKKEKIIVGIDQGNHFHLVVGSCNPDESVITRARLITTTDELEDILAFIKPDLTVMDMFPDQHYAKQLQKNAGYTKFFLVNLRSWTQASKLHEFIDHVRTEGLVNLERTSSLDHTFDSIRNGSLKFLRSASNLNDVLSHLQNIVPEFEERFGRKLRVYKKIGKDDFAHAINFFYAGARILYPGTGTAVSRIVPASKTEVKPLVGTSQWLRQDFESRMQRASGVKEVIVIPPKNI